MADPAGFVDYYSQCEAALTVFFKQHLSDYLVHDWQITDNESDMKRGANLVDGAGHFLLYRPGSKPETPVDWESASFSYIDWRVNVNIFVRYLYKSQQWPAFKKFRALIWYVLQTSQWLPNNANVEKVVSVGFPEEPFYWKFKDTPEDAQPNMMAQPMFVVLRQRINH